MTINVSELIAALPGEVDDAIAQPSSPATESSNHFSSRPIPISRFRRLSALGTLQAKIAAAYLFYWLRGWFKSADEKQRLLAEAHWRTALRLLDSMGYLRGAVMKVGQTLANLPDIAPPEFVETLEKLHFDAPPMHWSLLRELVFSEFGDDPERLFVSFNKTAFAAASLGQVHQAQLRTGEDVAVKIQYPGIADAIQSDFRNLFLFLLPGRLGRDWENTRDQMDDLQRRLTLETDYKMEAENLRQARTLFHEEDGVVIPEVYPQFSTPRVLTMERLRGLHLREFMATNPSQDERNDVAKKFVRAWYRLMFAGRMLYVDFHPGNFLVLDDGRIGILDFGCILPLEGDEWELFRKIDRPLTTGRQDDRLAVLKEWNDIGDDEPDRLRLCDEFGLWCWKSRFNAGEYDFGDEQDFRHGVELFGEMVRKRYSRSRANVITITRGNFGWRSIMYLLKAKVDIRAIAEEEVKATGWDRSGYAGRTLA